MKCNSGDIHCDSLTCSRRAVHAVNHRSCHSPLCYESQCYLSCSSTGLRLHLLSFLDILSEKIGAVAFPGCPEASLFRRRDHNPKTMTQNIQHHNKDCFEMLLSRFDSETPKRASGELAVPVYRLPCITMPCQRAHVCRKCRLEANR